MRTYFARVYSEETDLFPKRVTEHSLYDVFAKRTYTTSDWKQSKSGIYVLDVGTGCYIDCGQEDHVGIIIRGKAGLMFKSNIFAFHGYIDPDYRGEVRVKLMCVDEPIEIKKHKAIAQLMFVPVVQIALSKAMSLKELTQTDRGANGFGEMDKKVYGG